MPYDLEKQKRDAAAASMRNAFGGQPAQPQPSYDWRGLLELLNPFSEPSLSDKITDKLDKKPR